MLSQSEQCTSIKPGYTLSISRAAYDDLVSILSRYACEAGGLLAQDQSGMIRSFIYDEAAGCGKGAYRPTAEWCASVLRQWRAIGLHYAGFAHSHPCGYHALSPKDIACAQQFLQMNPSIPKLVMAIVCDAQLFLYLVFPDGCVCHPDVHII